MSELVVRGARLGLRNHVAAELIRRTAERTEEPADKVLLARPATAMSLCLDDLEPLQARRIAAAIVAAAAALRREVGALGSPPEEVEVAAQLSAVVIFLSRVYELEEVNRLTETG